MNTAAFVSLGAYFILMMLIGLYAYRKSTSDVSEYMLGGRKLHPAVGALSAGASDMSGWMLMGLPGAVFVTGFSAAWIAVGLVIGAYFNYRLVAPRLRVYTELSEDAITIPDFFEKRFKDKTRALRILSSVVIRRRRGGLYAVWRLPGGQPDRLCAGLYHVRCAGAGAGGGDHGGRWI